MHMDVCYTYVVTERGLLQLGPFFYCTPGVCRSVGSPSSNGFSISQSDVSFGASVICSSVVLSVSLCCTVVAVVAEDDGACFSFR